MEFEAHNQRSNRRLNQHAGRVDLRNLVEQGVDCHERGGGIRPERRVGHQYNFVPWITEPRQSYTVCVRSLDLELQEVTAGLVDSVVLVFVSVDSQPPLHKNSCTHVLPPVAGEIEFWLFPLNVMFGAEIFE